MTKKIKEKEREIIKTMDIQENGGGKVGELMRRTKKIKDI